MAQCVGRFTPLERIDDLPVELRKILRIAKEVGSDSRVGRCIRKNCIVAFDEVNREFKIEDVHLIDILSVDDAQEHEAFRAEIERYIVVDTAAWSTRDFHLSPSALDTGRGYRTVAIF